MRWLLSLLPVRVGCLMALMLLVSCASESQAYTPEQRISAEFGRQWREKHHIKTQKEEDEEHPVLEAVEKVLAVPTYPIWFLFYGLANRI